MRNVKYFGRKKKQLKIITFLTFTCLMTGGATFVSLKNLHVLAAVMFSLKLLKDDAVSCVFKKNVYIKIPIFV